MLVPNAGLSAQRHSGRAFGSWWHALPGSEREGNVLGGVVNRVIDEIDPLFSPYLPASVISRLNATADTDWVAVPPAFAELAEAAKLLHRATGGAFDPTVGPLVHRFGFGPIEGRAGDADRFGVRPGSIRKPGPLATLDLCGLAKGYALDRMIEGLAAAGVSDVMLELGGEVRCLGLHPSGRAWQIAVADPRPGVRDSFRVVAPGARALATSGHATQGFGTLTHLIDPRHGRPADTRLASVTVIADRASTADGLATGLAALGPEDGPRFAEAANLDALFLLHDGQDIAELVTGRFADHILA